MKMSNVPAGKLAVGDGHAKNTEAFTGAIQACADSGSKRVVVSAAGLWLTGPIELKSKLYLEQGALVIRAP